MSRLLDCRSTILVNKIWCLQQAGAVLEIAEQSSEEQRDALSDVTLALGRNEIISHSDKAGHSAITYSSPCTCTLKAHSTTVISMEI